MRTLCFTLCIEKNRFPSAEQALERLYQNHCSISRRLTGRGTVFVIEFGQCAEDKDAVLNCAVELICQDAIRDYINRALDTRFCYFNRDEKAAICGRLCNGLELDKLRKPLEQYLETERSVQLGGFVTFRMKPYFAVLDSDLEFVVDEFIVKKEYLEFIKLLKFFVDMQDSQYDEVHILPTDGYHYLLLDDHGRAVKADDLEDAACEVSALGINENDMLLSTLISIAPKRIVIHHQAQFLSQEIIETITGVFTGKVSFCAGCTLCGEKAQVPPQTAVKKE